MGILPMLETVQPREQSGRDAFGRFRAQARSAALASLSILEGKEVDRVYCDMHDDFVVRINREGQFFYVFYQVKTNKKQNHNWTLNEVFGLSSRIKDLTKHDNSKISNSFAGKLLLHTVNFGDNCEAVIFQTNINIEDPIINLMADVESNHFVTPIATLMVERFSDCFSSTKLEQEDVNKNLQKLNFETDVSHLKFENNNFGPIAKDAISKYSEIDLTHDEFKDILVKLVELVESKSSGVIDDLTKESIEVCSCVSIADLLEILSISKAAYDALSKGGDPLAVKNASIIQRTLRDGGASEPIIEYCARCKISWDEWFRNNRHVLPELDVMTIQFDLAKILRDTMSERAISFSSLKEPIKEYLNRIADDNYDLDEDAILGGVLAELVRMQR
jgi:hypothetical protein